ncbi:MAG TPA: hypothetical protein VJS44_17310 [Pyrinomonadaceae bacterium]|nr:hypothetical protein [Pyrinomonadaceae bacterium]
MIVPGFMRRDIIKGYVVLFLLATVAIIVYGSVRLSARGAQATPTPLPENTGTQQASGTSAPYGLDDWDKLASIAEHVLTVAAILAGGFWAYYKVFKGRVYTSRLELVVEGKVVTINGNSYLSANMQMENVGLTRVEIQQRGSGLDVYAHGAAAASTIIHAVPWTFVTTFTVFAAHEWIEPGERISEPLLVALPSPQTAYKLELIINSRGISWRAMTII